MRRPISTSQPMWLIHIDTWNYADPQKIIELVPTDIRPFVVMNISLSINHDVATGKWLRVGSGYETAKSWLRVCAENGMWAMIQPSSGGFSHFSDSDLSVYEEFFREYPNFIGFNYCEQFWGYDDPNDPLSPAWIDRINHFANLLPLCANYGGYLVVSWCGNQWSPSINPIGMLKRSPAFAAACREHTENYILCEKYTQQGYQHDMESLCLGAWLSGYSGHYGIRYDDTGWTDAAGNHEDFTMATYGAPFLEHVMLTGQTVIDAPELIWTQCFRETSRVSAGDGFMTRNWDTFPQFENMSVDLFRKVLDGTVRIPSRQEVIDRTKVVVINDVNSGSADTIYSSPDTLFDGLYRMETSGPHSTNKSFFKKSGRYPTVPTVYQLDDEPAKSFAIQVARSGYLSRWPTNAAKVNEFNTLFPEEASGDIYAGRHENGWVFYNPYKTGQTASGSIFFKYNTAERMELELTRYTSGVVKESSDKLEIYLNNHDVQLDNTPKTNTIRIHGASFQPSWSYVNRGTPGTAAPGVTSSWSGGVLTLTVVHNGPVDITVNCSGAAEGRQTDYTPAAISAPPPPASYHGPRQYEGEHFDYKSIGGIETNAAPGSITGFHGQGFLRFGTNGEAAVRDRVSVSAAATYRLEMRYSVEGGSRSGIELHVNGSRVTELAFPETPSFSDWATVAHDVHLNAGSNVIELRATADGLRDIYFDSLVVVPTTYSGGLVIQENDAGFGGVDGTIDSSRAGFTGEGYAAGTGVEWWLDFPTAGTGAFTFRYAGPDERIADLYVNGVRTASKIRFAASTSGELAAAHVAVPAGLTHVRLQGVSAAGLPDIDFLGVGVESSTGEISPVADAYVRGGGSATANFGPAAQIVAKHDAVDLNFNRITYLKFDVAGLAGVQSAKLKLVPFQVDGATLLHFERIADDTWAESGITFINRPTVAGTLVASVGDYAVGQAAEIDLTNAVQAEAAGDGILSLRITNEGWNFVGFHSRESTTAAFRPVLEYTLAAPVATPGAVKTAHLRFDEGEGTIAADATGKGWHGTLAGSSAWEEGRIEGSLALSSGSHVGLPDGVIAGVDDFTIGFWLKPAAITDGARVFDFSTGSDANGMSFTPRTPGGLMRFSLTTGGIEQFLEAPPAVQFTPGSWTHVTLAKAGDTATLYLDGAPVSTTSTMTHRPSDLGVTTVNHLGRHGMAGALDDFRIYRGALGAADVAKLANPPSAPANLTASPAASQVQLSWEAVAGATGYTIRRSTVAGGPYETVGAVSANAFLDTGVVNGTNYHYVVVASNGLTDGPRSVEASALPRPFEQSGGIVSIEAENGFLGSRWIVTAGAGASNGAYLQVDPIHNSTSFEPPGTTPEYVAAYPFNLSAGGSHRLWFRVFAATADDDSFFWRIDGGDWTMENGRVGDGTWYSVGNAHLDNLAAGEHVLEIIHRENGTGLDKFVIQPDGHPAPDGLGPTETVLPAAPGGLTVGSVQPSRIDLAWSVVSGASSYRVKRSTTSGGPYATIADIPATVFNDTAVTVGTTYHYIVTSVNGIGESGSSAQVSATPVAPPILEEERRAPSIEPRGDNAAITAAVSVEGRLYQLQYSDNLSSESWQNHGTAKAGTGGPLEFLVPVDPENERLFYRLLILQP